MVCGQRYITVFSQEFYQYMIGETVRLIDNVPEFDQQVIEELSMLSRKFFFSYSDIKVDDFKNYKLEYLSEPEYIKELYEDSEEDGNKKADGNIERHPKKSYEPFYILRKLNKLLQYRSNMNKHYDHITL